MGLKYGMEQWHSLLERLKILGIWIAFFLMDTVFVVFWIIIQRLIHDYVIKPFELSGLDQQILGIFQGVFAISTVAPIILYIAKDIVIVAVQAYRQVTQQLGKR